MSVWKRIRRLVKKDPVIILPYGGYVNHQMLHLLARVLEDEDIRVTDRDSILKNLYNSFKRFESDEIEGATVQLNWLVQSVKAVSDEEGYVQLDQTHGLSFTEKGEQWIPVGLELIEHGRVIYETATTLLKPAYKAEFGVISDIDDTILKTGVTSRFKWRVLVNSLLLQSQRRKPLPGACEFYQRLRKGQSGLSENPFFYLSNSPWNLYEYLSDFLEHHRFPKGVVLLRDMTLKLGRKKSFLQGNKYNKAKHILETYPDLPFVLIGDAAEQDLDIYLSLAEAFPKQIRQIYIYAVHRKAQMKRINARIQQGVAVPVKVLLSSEEGVANALAQGLIKA